MLSIERAGLAQLPEVLAFHRALYVAHRQQVMPPEVEVLGAYRGLQTVLEDDVRGLLSDPLAMVLLARRDGEALGYISAQRSHEARRLLPQRATIEDWFVHETARRQGVGTQLVQAMLAALQEAGCQVVEAMTWPGNDAARLLYEKLHFAEVEIRYRRRLAE